MQIPFFNKISLGKIIIIGGLIFLLSVSLVFVLGSLEKGKLKSSHLPPGKLIDMGGYKLHLNCQGEGLPVVILEAGQGGFSLSWNSVFAKISKFNRVCVYDRAGYGWSERKNGKIHPARDLRSLLVKAGETGPYLLVGHSLGGIFVRSFASLYPKEVVGLILVDPANEEMIMQAPEIFKKSFRAMLTNRAKEMDLVILFNQIGLLALSPTSIPPHPDLPDNAQDTYRALLAFDDKFFITYIEELNQFEKILDDFSKENSAVKQSNIPLYVLTTGKFPTPPELIVDAITRSQINSLWFNLHQKLVKNSVGSRFIKVENSGHSIQTDQPEIVVNLIKQMLEDKKK